LNPRNRSPLVLAATAVVVLASFTPELAAQLVAQPGWQSAAVPAAGPGGFVGGLAPLPNGNAAVFDGSAVVEVDVTSGAVLTTLYQPASSVFGSFLVLSPSREFLLFGESSFATITKIPLDGSPVSVVATVQSAYDLAFASDAVAYVSASPSFGTANVLRLDLTSGANDVMVETQGASGPLVVAPNGDLYYAEADITFPASQFQQDILRFSAGQLAAAIGPTHHTETDGAIFVAGLTTISDLAVDSEGNLVAAIDADGLSGNNQIVEYRPDGQPASVLADQAGFDYVGYLAMAVTPESVATFAHFQPADGGTILAVATDFFSFNDLVLVRPERATLDVSPQSPLPIGNFTVSLANGPPNGFALVLVASQPLAPEVVVMQQGTPFFFGVLPGTIAAMVVIPLDAEGAFAASASHHGGGVGGVAYLQAALIDSLGRGVGTSTTLPLALQ
jgi:hypothetical protein